MNDLNTEPSNREMSEAQNMQDASVSLEPAARDFQELSLAEVVGQLVRHPVQAIYALRETLRQRASDITAGDSVPMPTPVSITRQRMTITGAAIDWQALQPLLATGSAFLLALLGSLVVVTTKSPQGIGNLLIGGIPLLFGATLLTIIAARTYTFERLPPLAIEKSGAAVNTVPDTVREFWNVNRLRIALAGGAVIWAFGSWFFNTNNQFTQVGVFCWIMSIVMLTVVLMDRELNLGASISRFATGLRNSIAKPISFRITWTAVALIVILLLGGWYRFGDLSSYPPEMTSDHVEKLLDAVRVNQGARPIFFPNNGGREAFQMYYLAALKSATGIPFSFDLLKIGSGIEGMLMILAAFWLGRAVIGEEDRDLGNLTGIIMAALVATSYWHTLLSRLGLRIVTTPLVVTVVLIFLVRALRHNRRVDYLLTGLALGAGMYFYQAIRMLPFVVVAGLVLALFMRARSGRSGRQYLVNFGALVVVAVFVFIPLGHYMLDHPAEFWERTTGRLFGEAHIENPDGTFTAIPFSERYAAFKKNLPVLIQNIGNSALMFNWKGDSSWFNGDLNQIPALDYFTGALLVTGLGFALVRIRKRRDPVDVLLPLAIPIMLLPTALSIAFPIEVPSFTRASGTLPMVYLLAAMGLAILLRMMLSRLPGVWLPRLVIGAVVLLYLFGAAANYDSYFVNAMSDYLKNALPHREAGQILKGFATSTGAPGNAFVISYKYWMDHRAIGIEAGYTDWVNVVPDPKEFPKKMYSIWENNQGKKYEFKPDRQLLFFLNQEDKGMTETLKQMFPSGALNKISTWDPSRDFYIYVVAPPGCAFAINKAKFTPKQCAPADSTIQGRAVDGVVGSVLPW